MLYSSANKVDVHVFTIHDHIADGRCTLVTRMLACTALDGIGASP
jgi:hypothetical protein